MKIICMKCGREEYYVYYGINRKIGIKKCKACDCEMIDPHEVMERIIEEHRETLEMLNTGSKKVRSSSRRTNDE